MTASRKPVGRGNHPFGDRLDHFRKRKDGLTKSRLAELAGYHAATLSRMCRGQKDLSGPSGRDRVIRLIETLVQLGAVTTRDEADSLLIAANMPPLFEGLPADRTLVCQLSPARGHHQIRRTNLSAPLTRFIGRAQEIAAIRQLLGQFRLVTIIGIGGSGKTRIAQQVAADELIRYVDGVWYVELSFVSDPHRVADAIARELGLVLSEQPVIDHLMDYLRDRHALLVLDNCEQVIGKLAELIIHLLRECPRLSILSTSREAFAIAGEALWRLAPLKAQEAAELFVDRARHVRADRHIDPNDPLLQDICERLDRIPLAIELAAARISTMTLGTLAKRLHDRFSLLTDDKRGLPLCHQTLRLAIDWSYASLSSSEQMLFRRLSVFVGGWTLADAEALCAHEAAGGFNLLEVLGHLVNKSLVSIDEHAGAMRFRFLETIREYSLQRLEEEGELADARRRHVAVMAKLARDSEPHIHDALQIEWVNRLRAEKSNLHVALDWSLSDPREAEPGIEIAAHLWQFWMLDSAAEGAAWLRRALNATDVHAPALLRGRTYLGYAACLWVLSTTEDEVVKSIELALDLLARAKDTDGLAYARHLLGCAKLDDARVQPMIGAGLDLGQWRGNSLGLEFVHYLFVRSCCAHLKHPPAIATFDTMIKHAEKSGDMQALALACSDRAFVMSQENQDLGRVRRVAERGFVAATLAGASMELTNLTMQLARACLYESDFPAVRSYCRSWLLLFERLHWPDEALTEYYLTLGEAAREEEDFTEARRQYERSLRRKHGWPYERPEYQHVACLSGRMSDFETSARMFGISTAGRDRANFPWLEIERVRLEPYIAKARLSLGAVAYDKAFAAGYVMEPQLAYEYALSVCAQ